MTKSSATPPFHLPRLQFSLRTLGGIVFIVAAICWYFLYANHNLIRWTGRELDVALSGKGYLCISDPNTGYLRYARYGHMVTDGMGTLSIISDGKLCQLDPPITLPNDTLETRITPDGLVSIMQPGLNTFQAAGQIQVTQFLTPDQLVEVEPGFFYPSENSGPPVAANPGTNGAALVVQGWLEEPLSAWLFQKHLPAILVIIAFLFVLWEIRSLHQSIRELTAALHNRRSDENSA